MGTDKNKISAYLSDQDFSTLKTLAASYQVSKSQLVILAIRALAGQSVEVTPINLSSGVNAETMESLVKSEVNQAIAAALAPLSEDLENLKKQISDLLSSPPPFPLETKPVEMVGPMETIEHMESLEAVEAMETDFSKGLTGKELAKRLKFSPSGLSRAWKPETDSEPRPEYFRKWSQENDPDKLAWEKKGDKFFPVSD